MPKKRRETRAQMFARIEAEVQAEIAACPALNRPSEPLPTDTELDDRRRHFPQPPDEDGLWIKYGSKEPE